MLRRSYVEPSAIQRLWNLASQHCKRESALPLAKSVPLNRCIWEKWLGAMRTELDFPQNLGILRNQEFLQTLFLDYMPNKQTMALGVKEKDHVAKHDNWVWNDHKNDTATCIWLDLVALGNKYSSENQNELKTGGPSTIFWILWTWQFSLISKEGII